MEDFLHFIELYGDYVFRGDVLTHDCQEMWHRLKHFVIHYTKAGTSISHPFSLESRLEARDQLLEFACLCWQVCTVSTSFVCLQTPSPTEMSSACAEVTCCACFA